MELAFGIMIGVIGSAVVALFFFVENDHAELGGLIQGAIADIAKQEERIAFLEKRKALLTEAATSYQPQPGDMGRGKPKPRTWSEDVAGRD